MLVSLTVGKVDAGVAVLLTEDKRLIEFPSILLPPDISSGSIVDINVSRNFQSEQHAAQRFAALQSDIYSTFGLHSPSAPVLRCRNATQTSLVLEWDPVNIATAELRSLSLYRNGSKAGNIPRDKLSTKISGLAVDTEYTFHLVLRTSAGTYSSEKLAIRTQKMTDLTGITVTPGIMPGQLRDSLADTIERIGAKLIDTVRIDTTHFVCTEARGQAWEKAAEMNIPIVVPDWIQGCEREGRVVGVRGYYLNADPKLRQASSMQAQPQQSGDSRSSAAPQQQARQSQLRVAPPPPQQQQLARGPPSIEHTPPTPEQMVLQERTRPNGNGAQRDPAAPPPKMEPFPLAPTEMDEESNRPDDASYAAAPTSAEDTGDDSDDAGKVIESTEPPETVENLGPVRTSPEEGDSGVRRRPDDEGGFDEVDL